MMPGATCDVAMREIVIRGGLRSHDYACSELIRAPVDPEREWGYGVSSIAA